jgi:hypothetical protein
MTIFEKILYRIWFKLRGIMYFFKYIKRYFLFKDSVFIVYSAGKTGSSTIYYTLMKEFPFNRVFHVHFLSDYWIKEKIPQLDSPKSRNIVLANKVYRYLSRHPEKKAKYITLVRDPISRGISAYFHNKQKREQARFKKDAVLRDEISNFAIEISCKWFETDFVPYMNFNIFSVPFDIARGFKIYNQDNNKEVLVIRTDRLNDAFSKAVREFSGVELRQLFVTNKRKMTIFSELYNKVKKSYYENGKSLDMKLNSSLVNHFFLKEEIEKIRNRWKSKELEN